MPYSVYVIELRREVLEKKKFAEANPDCHGDKPCVYVGQTALSPEERFAQHRAGKKCNPYARDFGKKLRPKLSAHYGPYETRRAAEKAEEARGASAPAGLRGLVALSHDHAPLHLLPRGEIVATCNACRVKSSRETLLVTLPDEWLPSGDWE